jgi:hypothetical protein
MILHIARYPHWGGGWEQFIGQLAAHLRRPAVLGITSVERILGDAPKDLYAARYPPNGAFTGALASVRLIWLTDAHYGQIELSPSRVGPWSVRVRLPDDQRPINPTSTSIRWAAPWSTNPPVHPVALALHPDRNPTIA